MWQFVTDYKPVFEIMQNLSHPKNAERIILTVLEAEQVHLELDVYSVICISLVIFACL